MTTDALPPHEFCCEHAWSAAKQLAWKQRDLLCDCDHNESCERCFPLDFRSGGKWDKYRAAIAAAAPAQPEGDTEDRSGGRTNAVRTAGDRSPTPDTTGVDRRNSQETQEVRALPVPNVAPAQPAEPVAWLVTVAKNPRFVRACWTVQPSDDQLMAAAFDGDIITPLYATPQVPAPQPLSDRVAQLEAALRECEFQIDDCPFTSQGLNRALRVARAALAAQGKKL